SGAFADESGRLCEGSRKQPSGNKKRAFGPPPRDGPLRGPPRLPINRMGMPVSQEASRSFAKPSSHAQKGGRTTGSACLFFIARGRPICRACTPITRTSSQPFEGWVIRDSLEHPAEITVIIRRKTQFGSVPHDCRQCIEDLAGQEAPFLVA